MLPYDMNAFKREFIKKKTPEKEAIGEIAIIEAKQSVIANEKIDIEQSRSELMTTITSNAVEPPTIINGTAVVNIQV